MGGTTKLTSLTVDGGQIDLQSVKTTGAIDVEGTNIDLNGTVYETDGGNVTFTGPVDLADNVSVDSDKDGTGTDGRITFSSTVDGGQTLTWTPTAVRWPSRATCGRHHQADQPDGGRRAGRPRQRADHGRDRHRGHQHRPERDRSTRRTAATSSSPVPVDLAANVSDGQRQGRHGTDGSITFSSTIDGGQTLILDADGGAVALQGNVGGTTKLTSLTVDGGQIDLQSVKTTGAIDIEGTNIDLNGTVYETDGGNVTFTGPVDLTANVSVDSDKDGTGTDGRITFSSTIDGGQTLTLDADGGAVALQGNVGGTHQADEPDGGRRAGRPAECQDHGRDRRGGDEHRPERDGLRD